MTDKFHMNEERPSVVFYEDLIFESYESNSSPDINYHTNGDEVVKLLNRAYLKGFHDAANSRSNVDYSNASVGNISSEDMGRMRFNSMICAIRDFGVK